MGIPANLCSLKVLFHFGGIINQKAPKKSLKFRRIFFQMVAPPSFAEKMSVLPSDFLLPIQVEPVGRWFLAHYERMNCTRGTSIGNESLSESESEASDIEDDFEDDILYLRSLDPKECKDQDHYKVLGIPNLRFQATDDQIKRAYRQKVLKHHPDKRRGQGEEILNDDDYFTCITKAFETIGTATKRRAYDSVDPFHFLFFLFISLDPIIFFYPPSFVPIRAFFLVFLIKIGILPPRVKIIPEFVKFINLISSRLLSS